MLLRARETQGTGEPSLGAPDDIRTIHNDEERDEPKELKIDTTHTLLQPSA
jgi:hypothetical protein